MTTNKNQSNKKNARQTISISHALKDWIERFVNVNNKKDPEDERFKSVSSFYNYVLDNMMTLFENGKTLKDLENYVDGIIYDFYEDFSFRASIPYYEVAVEPNRYSISFYDRMPEFLLAIKEFYLKNPQNIDEFTTLHERFEKYAKSNKLTKEYKFFEVERGKPSKFILEYSGLQKNLHFENCKMIASIYGFAGFKIKECLYSDKSLYCRYVLEDSDLVYSDDIAQKQRIQIVRDNLSYFVNYREIVNDPQDYYLWMKFADDKDCFINFNLTKTRNNWIDTIIKDIKKYGSQSLVLVNLLKVFEKLHWISIIDEKEYIFKILLSKEKYNEEIDYMMQKLSEHANVKSINDNIILIPN